MMFEAFAVIGATTGLLALGLATWLAKDIYRLLDRQNQINRTQNTLDELTGEFMRLHIENSDVVDARLDHLEGAVFPFEPPFESEEEA